MYKRTVIEMALESVANALRLLLLLGDRGESGVTEAASELVLRVGSRAGAVLPAHRVSGGKLLLAELKDTEFGRLYPARGFPT